jgi:hypothetical protein
MKQFGAWAMLALTNALLVTAGEPPNHARVASGTNLPAAMPGQISSQRVQLALDRALREPQADKRLQLLSDLGANLSLAEIPDALKAADGLKELRERMVLRQATLIRWGELSPEDAFVQIAKFPESQWKANTLREAAARFARNDPERAAAAATRMNPGVSRNDVIALVANLWAQTNVTAALKWAGNLPDGAAKESALDVIRYVWVHSDPIAAARHIEKLPPGRTRNNLIGVIAHEWAARDHSAAIRWANGLSEPADSETALVNIAESWANRDPQAATAFAMTLAPGELRSQAAAMAASRWARQDPRKAADWSWESGDAEVRRRGVKEVLDIWAGVDPTESARWLEHLPPGPDRDRAFRDFASVAALWTPDIAVRDAMLISNEVTRLEVLKECLPRWFEVDPVAATNWLNTAPLPAGFGLPKRH